MADDSKEALAEERTHEAEERTLLAKQRTFSAWIRTGLGAMALGFAAVRLFEEVEPRWVVQMISATLLLVGGSIHGFGFWSYRSTFKDMQQEGVSTMPLWFVGLITFALLVCAAAGVWVIVTGSGSN